VAYPHHVDTDHNDNTRIHGEEGYDLILSIEATTKTPKYMVKREGEKKKKKKKKYNEQDKWLKKGV
jgi:hypothetical protein